MFKIEYQIELNDKGRPYIKLPKDYEHRPEDRFFAMEVTAYMLHDLLHRRKSDLDQETINKMDESARLIGQLSDEVAELLWGMMRSNAVSNMMFDHPYHIVVENLEQRDALPNENILFNDKIYSRTEHLKVYVGELGLIYELHDGITNENWVEV